MKRYCSVGEQEYQIEVYYNLGGMNYFSGRPENRGYYASVSAVKREQLDSGVTMVRTNPRDGVKKLILPVARKSNKAYQQAVLLAEETEINSLFDYLGVQYNREEIAQ